MVENNDGRVKITILGTEDLQKPSGEKISQEVERRRFKPSEIRVLGSVPVITPFNEEVEKVVFGSASNTQKDVKNRMFGEDNLGGLMDEMGRVRTKLDKLLERKETIEDDKDKFVSFIMKKKNYNREQAEEFTRNMLNITNRELAESTTLLHELNKKKLSLTREYFANTTRTAERSWLPPQQTGYNCVPMGIHLVGKRVLGSWPFAKWQQTKQAYKTSVGADSWTNPTRIKSFIREINEKGHSIGAVMCEEPLTLMAALKAGGMAIARQQNWDHVFIIQDYEIDNGEISFIVGSTLGSNNERLKKMSLEELDTTFFKPDQLTSVTVIVPS